MDMSLGKGVLGVGPGRWVVAMHHLVSLSCRSPEGAEQSWGPNELLAGGNEKEDLKMHSSETPFSCC